jgi:hypothetical protein
MTDALDWLYSELYGGNKHHPELVWARREYAAFRRRRQGRHRTGRRR